MATKNISITESAYRRLARLKREHESFSIVIERLTGKEAVRAEDYFGVLSDASANALEKVISRRRNEHRKNRIRRIKKIAEELS
ncbi:antitoxin VapB family protein [Candidatus Pacearchaeota archaeon]|nr:antitoxin VapB family protein [Candidatus Pacearchaeota archaeon]